MCYRRIRYLGVELRQLRQLRHFVTVAEELSFTRAAARLFAAQSTVSAAVRTLEEELQVSLLDRSGNAVATVLSTPRRLTSIMADQPSMSRSATLSAMSTSSPSGGTPCDP
ncbi:LysR family transcriptional regulator [Streptomyces sp. NPDC102365]|uniref:LysR family transcriptional regulator n=1 Tax=Streptomyces sp. NPDC102365 TaxID=3366162 RepID=UPI00382D79F3